MSRKEVEQSLVITRRNEKKALGATVFGLGLTAVDGFLAYKSPNARGILSVIGVGLALASVHDGFVVHSNSLKAAALDGVLAQDQLNQPVEVLQSTGEHQLHDQDVPSHPEQA